MGNTAPEKIWIKTPYGRHPEDWNFTDNPELAGRGSTAYVQASAMLELAAENARLREALELADAADERSALVGLLEKLQP